jgi:fatty-acyl-CoA synthase
LKIGSKTTEAELIEYLWHEIDEKLALPKHLHIMNELPLTAVGKVYKPALKRLAVKEAIEEALRMAEVSVRTVEVVDDPNQGIKVQIRLDGGASIDRAKQTMGAFALPFSFV